jgi:hypothetical protein
MQVPEAVVVGAEMGAGDGTKHAEASAGETVPAAQLVHEDWLVAA